MLLRITPAIRFSLYSLNPFTTGTTDMLAPLQFTSRTTGASSFWDTS